MKLTCFLLIFLFDCVQEIRGLTEEIEAKIKETIDADDDEQQVVRKAQASQGAKAPTKSKCNNKILSFFFLFVSVFIIYNFVFSSAKRKQQGKDSTEDEVSMDEDEPEMPGHPAHLGNTTPHRRTPHKKPSTKQGRSNRTKIVRNQVSSEDESSVEEAEDEEDEEENDSEKEAQTAAKLKKNGSSRSTRRMQSESDHDDFIKPASRGISLY